MNPDKNFRFCSLICDKWVPVTTAWRFLWSQMEERPPYVKCKIKDTFWPRTEHEVPDAE
jgi:hypothetical protein